MIFTIFFCGTGSTHRDVSHRNYINGELISTLAKNHSGSEYIDYLILDGPGSGNLQEDQKWVEPKHHHPIIGKATGAGWKNNVEHAMAVLKAEPDPWLARNGSIQDINVRRVEQYRKQIIPTQVNLIGWSRGGVTCHMMANAMLADPQLAAISVNIFTVDPVPGGFTMITHPSMRTQIGSNVKNYMGIYAADERSRLFSPLIPKTDEGCHTNYLCLPGRHATLVGNAHLDGASSGQEKLSAPGKIVRHLAEVFLTSHGTSLKNLLNYDNIQLLQLYDNMLAHAAAFTAIRKKSYTPLGGSTQRAVINAKNNSTAQLASVAELYYNGLDIFVNQHHESLFDELVKKTFCQDKRFLRRCYKAAESVKLWNIMEHIVNFAKVTDSMR